MSLLVPSVSSLTSVWASGFLYNRNFNEGWGKIVEKVRTHEFNKVKDPV